MSFVLSNLLFLEYPRMHIVNIRCILFLRPSYVFSFFLLIRNFSAGEECAELEPERKATSCHSSLQLSEREKELPEDAFHWIIDLGVQMDDVRRDAAPPWVPISLSRSRGTEKRWEEVKEGWTNR